MVNSTIIMAPAPTPRAIAHSTCPRAGSIPPAIHSSLQMLNTTGRGYCLGDRHWLRDKSRSERLAREELYSGVERELRVDVDRMPFRRSRLVHGKRAGADDRYGQPHHRRGERLQQLGEQPARWLEHDCLPPVTATTRDRSDSGSRPRPHRSVDEHHAGRHRLDRGDRRGLGS